MAAMLLVAGCSKKEETTKKVDKEKKPPEVVKEVDATEEFSYFFPLTGMGTNDEIEGRSVAVMVNNHSQARPQSGLHKADIVYELLAEGDITRFLAVFQSEQPDNIGPVRSARDYYIKLAKGLDSLFVAHGYSPEAKDMLESGYIDDLNGMVYDGTLFKRASFRKAPHNSYISFENVLKGAEQNNFDMKEAPKSFKFLTEKESESVTGEAATMVSVLYSSKDLYNADYEYDVDLGKYKRFSGDEQTIDLESKTPVLLDNIFIIEANHRVIDDYGRKDIDFESGGRAYLLQKGTWKQIEWKNVDGRIVPMQNGQEVGLLPGKTWVNVVPSRPGLEQVVQFTDQ